MNSRHRDLVETFKLSLLTVIQRAHDLDKPFERIRLARDGSDFIFDRIYLALEQRKLEVSRRYSSPQ
jgi:hypothetical protein